MDSCHIFNFLFGTRKATSELRKCFSGAAGQNGTRDRPSVARSRKSTLARDPQGQVQPNNCKPNSQEIKNNQQQHKTTNTSPGSPLKQIQLKLVNFATGGSESSVSRGASVTPTATILDDARVGVDQEPSSKHNSIETTQAINEGLVHTSVQAKKRVLQVGGPDGLGLACGIFEAQLVKLDDHDEDEGLNGARLGHADGKHDSSQLDENNNNLRDGGAQLKVIVENPANKLDNLDVGTNVEESSQRRINVYDNPLIAREADELAGHVAAGVTSEQPTPAQPRRVASLADTKMEKSERVRNLVQSFEISSTRHQDQGQVITGPTSVGSLTRRLSKPPDTPPKSNRAKCLNLQLTLRKPTNISGLFQDETFLARHFFDKLAPIDRCAAAQVCRKWRNILYANKNYWKDLVGVIDCTQLRREHLAECILNTLQTARLKHQQHNQNKANNCNHNNHNHQNQQQQHNHYPGHHQDYQTAIDNDPYDLSQLDQDEVWRIQELCNRYTMRSFNNGFNGTSNHSANQAPQGGQPNRTSAISASSQNDQNDTTTIATTTTSTQHTTTSGIANSKSSSSQISSSTLSSISISSLLSPLSESSRVDSIREKLYTALDERGFDSICLFGATDDDIEDLATKTRPNGAQIQIKLGRLSNCSISDRGLEVFLSTFGQLEELELTGCNEITNAIDLKGLKQLRRLIITDCINIADGLAQRLIEIVHQLEVLVVQAYHLTDAFLEFLSLNSDTSQLRRLELPNCKEITNTSAITIAKHFQSVETLSISGSTKINDDGIEILAEHMKSVSSLDLGWLKIGDLSLECLACDLRHLSELVLDRNVHITDLGLSYLATMANLTLLYVRWCPQLTDKSIKSISNMRSLTRLSLAGLHQITARGILSLLDSQQLEELELTNCPAVTCELQQFLSVKMPNCNIIY